METLKFKTNIKCGGCIATVTPFLNADENIEKWQVDLENLDRILTVETHQSAEAIAELVKKAGYNAQQING
jgi:copper chaperone